MRALDMQAGWVTAVSLPLILLEQGARYAGTVA